MSRFEQGIVWHGTWCMDWDCGLFEKVPHVRIGIMVGLERCLQYGLGLWKVLLESTKHRF
jgi:hypothetical protein